MATGKMPELDYPRDYLISIFGRNEDNFPAYVVELMKRHVPDLDESRVTSNLSRNGNYRSVRVGFWAVSRQHVEAIYQDLGSNPRVLFVF